MRKDWHGKVEGLKKQDLARGRREQVAAAHDLIDAHQSIIHNDGELVGEDAIGTTQNKIAHGPLHLLTDWSNA